MEIIKNIAHNMKPIVAACWWEYRTIRPYFEVTLFINCNEISLQSFTFSFPGQWAIHPVQSVVMALIALVVILLFSVVPS